MEQISIFKYAFFYKQDAPMEHKPNPSIYFYKRMLLCGADPIFKYAFFYKKDAPHGADSYIQICIFL